jgi:hypothetical protein
MPLVYSNATGIIGIESLKLYHSRIQELDPNIRSQRSLQYYSMNA